jgi:hypothetical protein
VAVKLRPGSFKHPPELEDWTGWTGSMAETIEQQFNTLLTLDGLPPLPTDVTDREVRDRRRFFLAVARGVALHLAAREEAFSITVPPHDPEHPEIEVE